MVLLSKGQWTENFSAVTCFWGYGILRAMGRHGPENKLWFSIDGPGGFLLAPGLLGCKSAGPCHL